MIPYKTFGELFSIGSFHVQAWGLMVAAGFLIGLCFVSLEAKRRKMDADSVYALALSLFVGGILGARIGWILTEAPANLSFLDYINIWDGGMISFGGLIGGLTLMAFYAYYKKMNIWKYLDIFAVGLPIGLAIGRVGCYLIGDHLGKGTVVPWAILMYGQLTHPVILYEIILLLGIFALMICLKNRKLPEGNLFAMFLGLYSTGRFFIDFLRVDPTYFGLTVAQYACLIFAAVSAIFLWKNSAVPRVD